MYLFLFIALTIGFLAIIYHFYPRLSSYIKNHIDSRNVLEIKERMHELDDNEKNKNEEIIAVSVNDTLSTVNDYLNMPYEFMKKLFNLYGMPLFYKTVDPFTK